MNTILTITGSDSTGGSGVQADIRAITELGGKAVSAVTCITIQNTLGIQEFYDIPSAVVEAQVEAIVNDVQPEIIKIGMIRNVSILSVIVAVLRRHTPSHVLYDPVVFSSNGDVLMESHLLGLIRQQLFPLCSLIILRRTEAEMILGHKHPDNILYLEDSPVHGLSNSLPTAIAFHLSQGDSLPEAKRKALDYVSLQLSRSEHTHSRSHELYRDFLTAVNEFFKQRSDVAYYANYLNVSSRYLSQVTARIGSQSPKSIIEQKLIDAIERDLRTTASTIQEIAYDYGFSSQAHFTKFFKRHKGITPSDYRKNQL